MTKQASQISQDYSSAIGELLYAAYSSELGVEVRVSDATQFIARAYRVRRQLGDEALAELTLKRSPTQPDMVWIVRKQQQEERSSDATQES